MPNESKSTRTDAEQIHSEALARYETIQSGERDQRKLAVEDMRFVNAEDGQWDEDARTRRANRPRYTINRIAGAIDQLVGDQRQNRTQIKVRPVSGGADEKTANVFNGLIRNIEAQSKAENAYDCAYDEEITGGYGGWRVLTEYNDDDSFEQDVRIAPINSAATSLWFDSSSQAYDKRDAKHAFLTTSMKLEEFKSRYPDATQTEFPQEQFSTSTCANWFAGDEVLIAEYWVKTPCIKTVALMSDGTVIDKDEEEAVLDELAAKGITIAKERKVKSYKVEMYKLNGAEVLEGPSQWAGKHIPLVPVFGKVAVIEGKTYVRGLTRNAKDPQRIYNYSTSATIEAVALTPKDPIWITATQASGHEAQFRDFAVKNQPFMLFNADSKMPGPPARTGAPSVQQALMAQTAQAADDIHATTNMYPPALGNAPQLLSEKSVASQAAMGDRGSYIYNDNLAKSIQYTGDILTDLIPKIYDTPRMVRILGLDGKSEIVGINQEDLDDFNNPVMDEQTGEMVIVNDLSKGKYDVVVETGPAYNTMRQESAAQLIELSRDNPVFQQLGTDLLAKNLNILEGEELTKRVRKLMIGQGIVEPNEEETEEMCLNQPQQPDPQQTAITDNINMETEKSKSAIELNDAKTQETLVKTQSDTVDAYNTLLVAFQKQVDLGIPLSPQQRNLLIAQGDIVADAQDVIRDEQPNSEQAADLARMQQN